jgi:hypothetical protein
MGGEVLAAALHHQLRQSSPDQEVGGSLCVQSV